ncbi:phage virion morphogenesis protein [Serratia fonticola]|uniref:phage virion morphogenesis protein n=1 Tax=Serratia fonticola TaxID=47917 RepID=UPI003AACEFEE
MRVTLSDTSSRRVGQTCRVMLRPSGSPYQARKRQPLRAKTGRIKRAMFQKLRTNRYMKATGSEKSAVVEFTGKVQRIARVHQNGLKDRPNPHSHYVQYSERQLIGFNKNFVQCIENIIFLILVKRPATSGNFQYVLINWLMRVQ